MEKNPESYVLLCDIGGTNSRFNLHKVKCSNLPPSIKSFYYPDLAESSPSPENNEHKSILYNPNLKINSWTFNESKLEDVHCKIFKSQSFPSMSSAFEKFFESFPNDLKVTKEEILVCISICGPVENQCVRSMANLPWTDVSAANLKQMGFKDAYLSNDFEAFGFGLARSSTVNQFEPLFQSVDLLDKEGNLKKEAKEFGAIDWETAPSADFNYENHFQKNKKHIMVVGVGTGVGTVMIHSYLNFKGTESHLEILPSEAGHCFFGFKNQRDIDLVNYVSKVRYKNLENDYLPFEYLVSGMSLPLIYSFLSENQKYCGLSGKEIFERCTNQNDPIALQTVEYFLDLFGQFIHQTAISFLPEVIVLRGPLLDSLRTLLNKKPELKWNFWRSLLAKTHMAPVYQNLTIFTIKETYNLSALGSLVMFADKCGE
jgi:glucokinase